MDHLENPVIRPQIVQALTGFSEQTELALGIIEDDQIQLSGFQLKQGELIPADNKHHLFEAGSITKTLVGHVLAKQVIAGQLQLDDRCQHFIKQPIHSEGPTLKALATHTAGLPRLPPGLIWKSLFKHRDNPYKDWDENQLMYYLQHSLTNKPTKRIGYSNLGFGILGFLLQQHSQLSFHQLMTDFLFHPLGMTNSICNRELATQPIIQGLNKHGQATPHWDLAAMAGAGAALTSIHDLSLFARHLMHADPAATLQKTIQVENKMISSALGLLVVDQQKYPERFFFHNGGTGGFSSALLIDNEEKRGVVALSNISGLHKMKGGRVDNLVFAIMKALVNPGNKG